VAAAALAPCISALGALAPNLAVLTITQALGRPIGLALLVLVGVVAAEEMPAGSRAYAVSVLAMATAFGAGICVATLPLADLGDRSWRLVYLVPLLFLFLLRGVRRLLPESRRYLARHDTTTRIRDHGRRFWLLAVARVLVNILVAPSSGFQNRYLTDERGFSATMITLYTLITVTPSGASLIIGGRLADLRGRKVVGSVGLTLGVLGIVAAYFSSGWQLWWWSFFGAVSMGLAVPALGVYDAELFPTGSRGRAGGWLTVLSLVGSSGGVIAAGILISRFDSYGWTMALLAIGPLAAVVLILKWFPETAGEELETLNPEDRPTS
jgi:MFS family permease